MSLSLEAILHPFWGAKSRHVELSEAPTHPTMSAGGAVWPACSSCPEAASSAESLTSYPCPPAAAAEFTPTGQSEASADTCCRLGLLLFHGECAVMAPEPAHCFPTLIFWVWGPPVYSGTKNMWVR